MTASHIPFLVTVTLTSDLVLRIIVFGAYIYILWGRKSKFGTYMNLGMGERHLPFSGHCDLDLWPRFNNNCVRSISLILFEIGIWNLVCECILGWWSVLYHLWVTVTLTSDLVLRKIVSGAYLILLKVGIPNLVCGCNFWWGSVTYHFWVTLTLTSELVCSVIVSRTYLLYYLRWESQICCMDTSLDADVSHTNFRSLWSWPMT